MTEPWFFQPLVPFKYGLVVIDCAQDFDLYSKKGQEKSQHAHYDVMKDDEIMALPVGHLAGPDCLLLCWATAPKLGLMIDAVKAWGFTYKSIRMWHKKTVNNKTRWGPGYRVRSTAEPLIVATIGNPKQAFAPPTLFDGLAREHSRKPDEFYDECDRLMPSAWKCDIFGRQSRPGWDVFGDQATKFDGAANELTGDRPGHDGRVGNLVSGREPVET